MPELTDITGVGPSYAEQLADAGYDSVEAVAEADAAEIDDVLERADGTDVVAEAEVLVLDEQLDSADDTDDGAEDDADDDTDSDTVVLEPGFSTDQENHLIRALVQVEVRNRQTNNMDAVDEIRSMIAEVKDGEPYELTKRQLDHAYTGVNQLEQGYRADRNINTFVGEMREVTQLFQRARQDSWGE